MVFRKLFSACRRFARLASSAIFVFKCRFFIDNVSFGKGFRCSSSVYLSCTDQGEIRFGDNILIGRNVTLVAVGGKIIVSDNTYIGDGSVLVAKQAIEIGSDTLIAEQVVIRDHDHRFGKGLVRESGFSKKAIAIGSNIWLAAKVTLLKGVRIGWFDLIGSAIMWPDAEIDSGELLYSGRPHLLAPRP